MGVPLTRLLLGRLLANREQDGRKIGAFEGVPAMGLDGLGSSAYGPEAALTILIPLGAAGPSQIGTVMLPILALLAILYVSYRQTVRAYPSNGGAYTVARENLGTAASLLAAAALMIDYVLNVAVGISAGVAALVSAVPTLHPYTLPLCLAILALITLVNLRGTLDAGRLFALPTYLFVASFVLVLALGLYKAAVTGGHPHAVVPPPGLPVATATVGLWLLLRAFASGCTAMTGVEAVSNGVSAFDLVVGATPVTAVDRDGHAVHLLASDPRGGLWHVRIGAEAGEPTQLAEGIAADRAGRLHLVTVGRDGQVGHEEALGGDFPIPLAVVEDGDELLLTARDAEDRVAVRTLRGEAAWEALGSLDELLEGPTDPVRLDGTGAEPASTA